VSAELPLRGSVLDVLRKLLGDHGERDTVLSIVGKLVAHTTEIERRLARMAARFKPSEQVSRAQLVLFLDALKRGEGEPPQASDGEVTDDRSALLAADDQLRTASGIDENEDDDVSKLRTPPPPRPPRSPKPPAHLPRVDHPIAVPAAQRACPKCGADRACVEPHITEVIELVPPQVIVRRDIRERLACAACEGVPVRAPAGETVVPAGKLGLGLVASILVEKYLDGLPLHRQRDRYRRLGLDIAVSTLADQVKWCTDLLRPVWRALLAGIIDARVMHLDGTGLPVLDSDAVGGKRLGALWGYVGVNASEVMAAYLYVSSGKAVGQQPNERGPQDILALRAGLTVADASNLFDESFARAELIECGCNMHARRYFVKALDAGDQRAALPLAAYKRLYKIEDEIRALDPDAKLAERQSSANRSGTNSRRGARYASSTSHLLPSSALQSATSPIIRSHWHASSSMAICRSTTASSSDSMSARRSPVRTSYSRDPTPAANARQSRTRSLARVVSPASIRASTSPTSCRG
jgi:transposase